MRKKKVLLLFVFAYALGIASPYVSYWVFNRFVRPSFGVRDEVLRLTSPDDVLDAVVMRTNVGAFSSFLYNLYLVPKGTKKIEGIEDPIVSTSEGDAPVVRWDKAHFLNVDIGNSHVMFFGNLWYSKEVNDYYVELTLAAANGKHYLQQNGRLRAEQ